jgi:hypothetical protein
VLPGLLLLLGVAPLTADDVKPRSPEVHQFMSPMVLDYSLGQFFKTPADFNTPDLARFECRGVTIQRLTLGIERGDKGRASVKVLALFNNNSGKDKRTTITFDLRTESSSLGSGTFRRLGLEQGDSGWKVLSFPVNLPAEVVEPYPFLRITIELLDY